MVKTSNPYNTLLRLLCVTILFFIISIGLVLYESHESRVNVEANFQRALDRIDAEGQAARQHNCQVVREAFDAFTEALVAIADTEPDPAKVAAFRGLYEPKLKACK